jgi:phospholipid/cholesterol/gamma-HCH transport system substrate-binding protein
VPSRREIQWSQLKVGLLVLAAVAILIGLVFLMNGSTGGLFARKMVLRSYFPNAAGIKEGAPVTLEGVTIGNVSKLRVVPERNPDPVEVKMQIGEKYLRDLHTDSKASIAQAGVLGDSYVDIDSTHASGPAPLNDAELQVSSAPTIQDVISSSSVSIQEINGLMHKIEMLVDTLNTSRGTVGALINDPEMRKNVAAMVADFRSISGSIATGKGSAGKFINDDTLYTKMDTAVDQLNTLTADLNAGKGSAGKFLKDDEFYRNLNSATANANQIVASINAGNGTIGKLMKDPETAKRFDAMIGNLNEILKGINAGEGTLGQLAKNRSLYDHLDQTTDQSTLLLKAIREDPKKYFVIRLKLF